MGWSDIQPGWEMVVRQQPGARHYFRHHRRLADARDLVRRAAGRQPSECFDTVNNSTREEELVLFLRFIRGVEDESRYASSRVYVD